MKALLKSRLAKNAGWTLIGQGLGYGLRVVYFIAIARLLGVLQYGILAGGFALVNLVAQYARLGMGTVLLRYVSGDRSRFALYWGNILMATVLAGSAMTVVLRFVGPRILDSSSAGVIAFIAVACCLFEQITMSATQAFQAFQQMRTAAMIDQLTSLFRAAAACGMLVALGHASARQWAIAMMLVSALSMLVAVTTVTVKLGLPKWSPALFAKRCGEGVEYSFASSTSSAYNDLDKTMLSHYGMSAENGIYGLAYRIIDMASVPAVSIQLAAVPRLFELAESDAEASIQLGRRLLRHGILVSGISALGIFLFAPCIPLLTGKGFGESVVALRWLSLIPMFRSVHGICGSILTSIGQQRFRTLAQITVVVVNFGLNLWLIPSFGWLGAAWSSLATDALLGILTWAALARCQSLAVHAVPSLP
jgi:O-antigen/teichoic acid export membrane protein